MAIQEEIGDMNDSKQVIFKSVVMSRVKSGILGIIGWFMAVLFGIIFIVGVFTKWDKNTPAGLTFCLICLGIGIFFIIMGRKIKVKAQKINKYAQIIEIQNETSVERIAGNLNMSVDSVITDLQGFIAQRIMKGVYVDMNTHQITYRNAVNGNIPRNIPSHSSDLEKEEIACNSCGAINQIVKGSNTKCEYCGTILPS
jgi:hypothetical protein